MASVASLVRGSDGYMKFIDYQSTYKDNNKEFLRGDMWELQFINVPKIVYFPGTDIFNARLNAVQEAIAYTVSGYEQRLRANYTIIQQPAQHTAGTLSLAFVDKEDQAITYWFDNLKVVH